jgi:hypothetical protein
MQLITVELTGSKSLKALQNLEQKDLIRIVKVPELNFYALPGEIISDEDFRSWIDYSENSATLSMNESKQLWAEQKKKLQKLIR